MLKQVLLYLFCVSIILQSTIGMFMFHDHSSDTFYTRTPSLYSDYDQYNNNTSFATSSSTELNYKQSKDFNINVIDGNATLPKLFSDLGADHLFSPSNCLETSHTLVFFSYIFLRHCFDLFSIEEKISNIVHYYSSHSRNIRIGLPSLKIIYPYHNFY